MARKRIKLLEPFEIPKESDLIVFKGFAVFYPKKRGKKA